MLMENIKRLLFDGEESSEDLNLSSFGIGLVLLLAVVFFGYVSNF